MQVVLSDPIGQGGPYKSHVMRDPEHDESVLCGFQPPPWMKIGWPNRATVDLSAVTQDQTHSRKWQRQVCGRCARIAIKRAAQMAG